ncbi:MAG: hypothetical protein QNJ13_12025 [Paracoccaceae bacterium]|nr:hypothetical protein [Paracoccaceae bacterium]
MEVLLGLLLLGLAGGAAVGLGGGDDDGDDAATLDNEETEGLVKEELNPVVGTENGDYLDGGEEGDWVLGNGGDGDILNGNGGDDYLELGPETPPGDDEASYYYYFASAFGGAGDDTIDATGIDSSTVVAAYDPHIFLHGGEGADTVEGSEFGDSIYANGLETYNSSGSNVDEYADDGEVDVLNGNGGSDGMFFAGGDIVSGGDGRDFFYMFDADDAAEDNNPAIITDFDSAGGEILYVYGDVTEKGYTLVDESAVDYAFTDDGDVEVTVDGETVAVLQGAADGFTYENLRPILSDAF